MEKVLITKLTSFEIKIGKEGLIMSHAQKFYKYIISFDVVKMISLPFVEFTSALTLFQARSGMTLSCGHGSI